MTTPAHADPNSGLLKAEPVIIAHLVLWLIANAGVLLVSRYHVVTDAQWNVVSVELSPLLTAVLLGASAWLIRRVVTPAWKVVSTDLGKVGVDVPPLTAPQAAMAAAVAADQLPAPLTADQLVAADPAAEPAVPADTTGATA